MLLHAGMEVKGVRSRIESLSIDYRVLPLFAVFAACTEWFGPGGIQAHVISLPFFFSLISGESEQAVVDVIVLVVCAGEK